jgi:hypothetical protein
MITKNELKIIKDLKYYKQVLGLQDWEISVHMVKQADFNSSTIDGSVWYELSTRIADIKILKKEDAVDRSRPYNQEEILLHELLHIKLGFNYDHLKGIALDILHQNIDDLARAIIKVKEDAQNAKMAKERTK